MRWRLASCWALLLAVGVASCGSERADDHDAASVNDAACWTAHECSEASCCDPICAGAHPTNAYGCPEEACTSVGYVCTYFEYTCTCGADGTWQYMNEAGGPPLDLSFVSD